MLTLSFTSAQEELTWASSLVNENSIISFLCIILCMFQNRKKGAVHPRRDRNFLGNFSRHNRCLLDWWRFGVLLECRHKEGLDGSFVGTTFICRRAPSVLLCHIVLEICSATSQTCLATAVEILASRRRLFDDVAVPFLVRHSRSSLRCSGVRAFYSACL